MLRGVQVYIIDENGDRVPLDLTDLKDQVLGDVETKLDSIVAQLQVLNSLVPEKYDTILMTYTGDRLDLVVFKLGGAGGSTVVTLTLSYTGTNLTSVVRT